MRLQDTLQTKYTGGTVLHIFLGEQVSDTTAGEGIDSERLPTITGCRILPFHPLSVFVRLMVILMEQKTCSICQQETEVYSRVVGYLRPVKQWNNGKQAEYGDRKTFQVAEDGDGGSQITDDGRKMTEVGRQITDDRRQMTEARKQKTEASRLMTEVGRQTPLNAERKDKVVGAQGIVLKPGFSPVADQKNDRSDRKSNFGLMKFHTRFQVREGRR